MGLPAGGSGRVNPKRERELGGAPGTGQTLGRGAATLLAQAGPACPGGDS
jgi:hypothetical protein